MFALNAAKFALRGLGEMREFHAVDAMVDRSAKVGEDPGSKGAAVAALVIAAMPDDGQEHLVAVALDAHGLPVAYGKIATGSVDNCPLFARDVYAWALTIPGCRFVGIAHNHPSGEVTPSGPDVSGSALVAKGGAMLALDLVWSMIVTHEGPQWSLVPIKGERPKPGEREPHAPKDPDGDPEPEPEPEPDGTPNDEPGEGDDEPEDAPESDSDDDDEGEGEGEGDDPSDEPEGDSGPEGDPTGDSGPDSTPDPEGASKAKPDATAEALRAAVRVAFGLKT